MAGWSDREGRRKTTWDELADEARLGLQGADALVEAMRRQDASATTLGKRIWWLNLRLLVFTIAICALTAILVWKELHS